MDYQSSKKRKTMSATTYPGTPIKPYGPTRKDMKRSYVTKDQLLRAVSATEEKKTCDISNTGPQNITTSGTISDLSPIAQGTSAVQRVGDKVLLTSLKGRCVVTASTTAENVVRIIIFRWMMNTNSDVPSLAEILEGAFLGSAQVVCAPYSSYNRDRFQVLYDKSIAVQSAVGTLSKVIQWNLKLAKKKIHFYTGGSTAGQFKIYMLQVSDDGIGNYPTTTWINRMNYSDA